MNRVIAIRQGQPRAVIMAGLRGAPGTGGGGSAGVSSFNTRTGAVTLTGTDVTAALGYAPVEGSSLADVATSGSYLDLSDRPSFASVAFTGSYGDLAGLPTFAAVATSGAYGDLSGLPTIPSTPAEVGAATAAQGALAQSAVQPEALAAGLDAKVDKATGYGLSQQNFTQAEKDKLAALEGSHYRGTYLTLAALQAALPTANAGDYADVDAGEGAPVLRYIWDASDSEWVAQAGSADPITAAQVKSLYESNPDTNAYTNAEKTKLEGIQAGAQVNHAAIDQAEAEGGIVTTLRSWSSLRVRQAIVAWWEGSAAKTKLDGIAAGATANANTDSLAEGVTNLYYTAARVRSAVLTGMVLTSDAAVAATDTILIAAGKLQRQINDIKTALSAKQATLVSGTNIKTVNGESLLGSGNVSISASAAPDPVAVVSGTAATAALADIGRYLRFTNAAAKTYTIPPQAAVAWTADAQITVRNAAASNLTLTPGAGVTLNAPYLGTLIVPPGGTVALKRGAENAWDVMGGTTAA